MATGQRVQRAKSLAVNTARANAGLINDIIDATLDQWIAGDDFSTCLDNAQGRIADAALQSHEGHIRAGLTRAGLELPDGAITAAGISDAINAKSGLNITDFTPDGVLSAVDAMLAKRISEVTGIEITSVIGASLTDQLKAGVRLALRSGQAKKMLGVVMERRAREMATLKRLNSDKAELRRLKNRAYQAEYRKTHKLVWE